MIVPAELQDITAEIPDAILDIRYATTDNFTGQQLYVHSVAWLRPEAVTALKQAAEELLAEGYRLVIFDAFRPSSVQKKLRSVCDDDNYVMEVSNHCRGITVDLTLADTSGSYLDMGTDYDDFSERAHSGTDLITDEQKLNRRLLDDAMTRQGFIVHANEWWHYDFRLDLEWSIIEDELNALK